MKRSNKNTENYDKNITKLIPKPYVFAIQNTGNITYSLSNSYGESGVEGIFKEAELNIMSEMIQTAKTSRFLNSVSSNLLGSVKNTLGEKFGSKVPLNLADVGGAIGGANQPISDAAQSAGGLAANAGSLFNRMWDATVKGQKIDIPNIWKSSSAPISQNVTIVLHSAFPNNNEDYLNRIIYPLEILLALSAPYSQNKKEEDNDILTFENPPYLEAEIDGVFKSKLCAIQSCQIEFPLSRMDMINGGRPYLVNVQLTIIDLYNTIVWNDDGGLYAPNAKDIINNLKDHKNHELQPKIDDTYMYYMVPAAGGSGGAVQGKDTVSSAASALTGDSNVASAASAAAGAVASGNIPTDPSAIAGAASAVASSSQYSNYASFPPLITNGADMSNPRYNELVQDYLNRHVGADGPDEYMRSSEERWQELITDYGLV